MEALISVATVYFFIVIGFIAKRVFKDKIDDKSFVIISLYFLQPILIFWGLTRIPINFELIITPAIYFVIVFIVLIIMLVIDKKSFTDKKDSSIYLASSVVGNTGNLGIPLGIALFGEASVAYTSVINISNVFFIYIISAYFFARERFNFKESLKSILKIPAISAAIIAVIFNYFQIPLNSDIQRVLEMGGYSAIVIQLMIFGIYMASVKVDTFNLKLVSHVSFIKHLLLPAVGIVIILFSPINNYVGAILLMELMVPLAVNNINLAAIYNCKPYEATATVLVSTLLFVILIYFYILIIKYFFGI